MIEPVIGKKPCRIWVSESPRTYDYHNKVKHHNHVHILLGILYGAFERWEGMRDIPGRLPHDEEETWMILTFAEIYCAEFV